MIIPDDKRAVMTIISKRSPKGDSLGAMPQQVESSRDEHAVPDPRHAAAQDMIMAMHEKSAEKLKEAMANFHDLHMAHREVDKD